MISQVSLEHNHLLEDRRHVIVSHTKTSVYEVEMVYTGYEAEMGRKRCTIIQYGLHSLCT